MQDNKSQNQKTWESNSTITEKCWQGLVEPKCNVL